jgi:hypothetical protein
MNTPVRGLAAPQRTTLDQRENLPRRLETLVLTDIRSSIVDP